MINKHNKGFTLIEVIIYIALFSFLIGNAFVVAYQLIDNSGKLETKNNIQEEGNFVMRKLNWALTGVKTFSISDSRLTINKYNDSVVIIKLGSGVDAKKILMNDTGSFLPITTGNMQVEGLNFTQVGTDPIGVSITVKIKTINTDPQDFNITKYLRK